MTLCQTGHVRDDQFVEKYLSSRKTELLLAVERDGQHSLQAQIERQLREAIRSGSLQPGGALPSTRDLARDLGVSRPLVMEAYAQLAAEGYLAVRQGATPRVAESAPRTASTAIQLPPHDPAADRPFYRYDFRPGIPDLASFPSSLWLKAVAAALKSMRPADFGYTQRYGSEPIRQALARYLGRVRGVSADSRQILITGGYEQARTFLARALRRRGVRTLAVEDPGYADREIWIANGFTLQPVPVDEEGIDVARLAQTEAEAVLLTPAHQYPTGVVMSGARRLAMATWLRDRNAVAVEDDYDAEFRYDRAPIGALQGLAPEHVVYAGTASKTLAPALRLGWMVVPPALLPMLEDELRQMDYGRGRIDQHALARIIESGDFDRHLRRMRVVYRDRREALLGALESEMPGSEIGGVSAGLHATVKLPRHVDEAAVTERAGKRDVGLSFMSKHYLGETPNRSTLLLSYANQSEAAIRSGIKGLAAALQA
jgi:GntR family transcriptional regulator/MocR family aminotransferase